MATKEEDGKLKLAIEDYPYANDGLLVWDAIKEWASDYVEHYYPCTADIVDDEELQGWWTEVRTKGHEDKKDGPWWPQLDSHESLVQVQATIMWVTSAHHAAVNFGQYPFAGYFPNRPTIARRNMPSEMGVEGMDAFEEAPEKVLLDTFPSMHESILVLAIMNLLSSHSPDEEYMGTYQDPAWEENVKISKAFDKFKGGMMEIVAQINEWNKDRKRKNRHGAGVVPYVLLKPSDGDPMDKKMVMEMGIPNSISI
uniref:Lipoxygenase domain-containing protein n=1 Tax=Triticum urartu TaxID=4572 RepID=A0A8R7V1F4_TRIUA